MSKIYSLPPMSNTQKSLLHVFDRIEIGKNASKLRKMGQTVGNVFGEEEKSIAIKLNKSDVQRHLKNEGESGLIYLSFDESDKEIPVLIDEIQYDPITSEPLHLAFKRVNLKEKVQAEVPLELVGEASIVGANIFLVKDMLEVEALPADLPDTITLNISGLTEIGQSLSLADAVYDRATIKVLLTKEEIDEPLVIVQEVKEEVVEEVVPEVVEGEVAPTEGAATEVGSETANKSDEPETK